MNALSGVVEAEHMKNLRPGRDIGVLGTKKSCSYRVDSVLNSRELAPNYTALAQEHAEMLKEGKTSEEIAHWTGEKLHITAWREGKFYGKRRVLSTPETPEERERFQKFIVALGVKYAHEKGIKYSHANGPSLGQPHYFLLDGFVQNAWLGEYNMVKRTKKLIQMNHALVHVKDEQKRAAYIFDKIGLDIQNDWTRLNIGQRSPLKASSTPTGVSVGGSFYTKEDGTPTKMVNILGFTATLSDMYENTAATGRLCFLG